MSIDVVTGATGQVGRDLCRGLLAAGRRVRAVVLPSDPAIPEMRAESIEVVEGDVRDRASLSRAFEGATDVHHLAAIVSTTSTHDPRMWQVNVEGARNAAHAAHAAGVRRMVYFSSIVVFDPDPLDLPLDETRPRLAVAAGSPYVRSKVVAEAVVRDQIAEGLDAVIVHPTVVIGPNETHHEGVVSSLLFNYFAGKLPAVFAGGFDAVAVSDVVDGAIAAAQRGRAGESYILGGEWHSIIGLLKRTKAICGASVPRVAIPLSLARRGLPLVEGVAWITGSRPAFTHEDLRQLEGNSRICTDKAQRELGYRPQGLDDALRSVHQRWLQLR